MDPYVGELRIFPWGFAPKGWALCNGQILAIQQNAALFSLLGVTYGGDGRTTFALPDLRSRVPLHFQAGTIAEGAIAGTETNTLTMANLPVHTHTLMANKSVPNTVPVTNTMIAAPTISVFANASGNTPVAMATPVVSPSGGSAPVNNVQPFLVLNICIALSGIYPPRG